MDFALARTNMVKSQVVPNGVTDGALLGAMMDTPRELFAATTHTPLAYSDSFFPLSETRRGLKPLQAARLIQALGIRGGEKILLIGAGTGYEAALLAKMNAQVFAVEANGALIDRGRQQTDGSAVVWQAGEPAEGWPDNAPFNGIVLLGSVVSIPDALLDQVADDGVLVAIVGTPTPNEPGKAVMHAVRVRGRHVHKPDVLFETYAESLTEREREPAFVL